jgi:hypothetical protein
VWRRSWHRTWGISAAVSISLNFRETLRGSDRRCEHGVELQREATRGWHSVDLVTRFMTRRAGQPLNRRLTRGRPTDPAAPVQFSIDRPAYR